MPNKSWTVAQLRAWLDQEGIAYESSDLKADLQRKAGVLDDGDA
ncbi:HeH/LEM domain-containing protein [Enterococcus sp.]